MSFYVAFFVSRLLFVIIFYIFVGPNEEVQSKASIKTPEKRWMGDQIPEWESQTVGSSYQERESDRQW